MSREQQSPGTLRPFHLAVQVRDIAEARAFYGGVLGCAEGRRAEHWVDFDLCGHQLVCHLNPALGPQGCVGWCASGVDGESVPIPHFGVVLTMADWEALVRRLETAGVGFLVRPQVRFRGLPGEQATFFIRDPSGNALEFKGFGDVPRLFARQEP
jgi:hypothetical protein